MMKFEIENHVITEAYTTIKKASRELEPGFFLEAIEKLIKDTFGDDFYISQRFHEYDERNYTSFLPHDIGCDMQVHRMGSSEDNEVPYIMNIRSVQANYGGDEYVDLISIGGMYRAFPNSDWSMSTKNEHELKGVILYLAFCLNKFFNHK